MKRRSHQAEPVWDQQRFSIPDIDAKINHFQSINAGIVTTIVTTLLSLSIGLIAYATNIVVTSAKPLVGASKPRGSPKTGQSGSPENRPVVDHHPGH